MPYTLSTKINNPSYFEVFEEIKNTQDNNTLTEGDIYSDFLISLIHQNRKGIEIDIETLVSDLKYSIHQITQALNAMEQMQDTCTHYVKVEY